MLLLVLFAFVAGAGTAISPCVLPVLPALLSAGATGGRRRPLGIVLGLALTFTITIVALAKVVDGVGLGASLVRDLAIAALALFGVVVAVPRLADRFEAPLTRLARFGPKSYGSGFWSGLGVGAALGFVYAPCAGPVLAAVVSVSAASGRTVTIALAYAAGSAVVLLALALLGRRIVAPLRGPALSRVLGGVMVLTAVAMAFQLDVRFQTAIADHLPAALVNPTNKLETSEAASKRLAKLRPPSRFQPAATQTKVALEDLGTAPDFTGNDRWFNSKPLTLARLKGRVVLVDFWTYTCINCIRTLPYLVAWDKAYRDKGLTIVGVHSPEFTFERNAANVERALKQNGIEYPGRAGQRARDLERVGQPVLAREVPDRREGPRPLRALRRGRLRQDRGRDPAAAQGARARWRASRRRPTTPTDQATPETYLGAERAEGFVPSRRRSAPRPTRRPTATLPESHFALRRHAGRSRTRPPTAGPGASLRANVTGKDVYLVLSGPGDGRRDRRRQARADGQGHHAEALPPALAPAARHARPAAALLARRRGLRVHVRVIRRV